MKLKIVFALILGMTGFHMQAQADNPLHEGIPEIQFEQFDQLSELFDGFDFGNIGGDMLIDTMIFKQFGGNDFDSVELDQMMEQMMEMVQSQMSQFDFGTLPLDQMLEELDLNGIEPQQFDQSEDSPGDQNGTTERTRKKKLKTYQL